MTDGIAKEIWDHAQTRFGQLEALFPSRVPTEVRCGASGGWLHQAWLESRNENSAGRAASSGLAWSLLPCRQSDRLRPGHGGSRHGWQPPRPGGGGWGHPWPSLPTARMARHARWPRLAFAGHCLSFERSSCTARLMFVCMWFGSGPYTDSTSRDRWSVASFYFLQNKNCGLLSGDC